MSTQSLSDIATVVRTEECDYPYCDTEYNAQSDDHDSPFCSKTCRQRSKVIGTFEDINNDRRFCSNCFRQIRTHEEPGRHMRSSKVRARYYRVHHPHRNYPIWTKSPDDPTAFFRQDGNRDCATLQSTPTKNTQRGAGKRLALSDPGGYGYQSADDPRPTAACDCGILSHRTTIRPVKTDRLMEYAKRLSSVVEKLREEGGHEYPHDRDTFLDEVRERKTDPEDHTPDQRILVNALADALVK